MNHPTQLHVAHDRWPDGLRESLAALMHLFAKCKPAGFWTSSETAAWTSEWTGLCESTLVAREKIRWPPAAMVRLRVVGTPRIKVLRNDHDFAALLDDHGRPDLGERARDGELRELSNGLCDSIFWDDLSGSLDAIWFRPDAAASITGLFEEWECESTVWFAPWKHLEVVEVRELAGPSAEESEPLPSPPPFDLPF